MRINKKSNDFIKNYRGELFAKKHPIIIIIISLCLLLLILAGYFYYVGEENAIKRDKQDELKTISDLKINQLVKWKEEIISHAVVLSRSPYFIRAVQNWLWNRNDELLKNELMNFISSSQIEYRYESIIIASPKGLILLSSEPTSHLDTISSEKNIEVFESHEIIFTDLYFCKEDSRISCDFIAPLIDKNNNTIAKLIFRISPANNLYPLIQSWPTYSKSSETLLIKKEGENVLFLNELKYKKNTALKFKISLKDTKIPAVQAVLGYTGIFDGKDYRNVDVLSYISSVPGTSWFLIAKVDKSEIYGELYYRLKTILIFTLLIILLLFLGISYFYILRQKKLFETLLQTEVEFKTTIYSLAEAVIITDSLGRVKYLNHVSEELTGWTEAESKDKPFEEVFEIINEITSGKIDNFIKQILNEGKNIDLSSHTLLVSKQGEKISIKGYGSPLKDKKNKIIGSVFVFKDQTKERSIIRKLRESENRYRKMFENHAAVKLLIDPESGDIVDANQTAADYYGWEREQLKQMKIQQISILSSEKIKQMLKDAGLRKKNNFDIQQKIADNSISDVEIFTSSFEIRGKTYLDSIIHDITDKIEAEKQIKLLSRSVEQAPISIFITDSNGNIKYVNSRFTEITAYTLEEMVGKNPRTLKSGLQTKEFYKNLWDAILSGNNWEGELQNKKKNGELYWVSSKISPVVNNIGEIAYFVATEEDITVKKQMIGDLISAKEKAEEMNRIKSHFFANMSHELRIPFVGLVGYANLLLEELTDPELRSMAEGILFSSKRLTETLSKILVLAKTEFSIPEVHFEQVNIVDIINEVYKLFALSAVKKNISFKKNINFESFFILTNQNLLSGILNNLVNNALKFTFNGEIEISAELKSNNNSELLILKVSDTGIGIPKDRQEIIWEEFRQVSEGISREFEGTGLGLSIVKRYVQHLGGKIRLESQLGMGSTFTMEFPVNGNVSPVAICEAVPEIISTQLEVPENKLINRKILYVEDDAITRTALRKILLKFCDIDLTPSAEKALLKVKEKQYDLILMDINLGSGMNGLELSEVIRNIPGYDKIPIIAVTAYSSDEDKKEILSGSINFYLLKPFLIQDLLNLLNKIFDEKESYSM